MRLPLRLPRFGLAQRTMLLLVAAVTGSLLVFAAGFAMQRRADYTEFADARARAVAAQVHSTRLVLLSVPLNYRRNVSEGLRASGTVYAFPATSAEPPKSRASQTQADRGVLGELFGGSVPSGRDVAEAIARYTPPPTEVRYTTDPGPRFWVSQLIDGESWWIVVLAGQPPPPQGGVPWIAVAAVLLGLLLVATVYAATITRPLRELAGATRRLGDGWPPPVHIDGAAELRDLADSFNGMLVRLRQIENERLVLLGGLPHDLRAPLTRLRLRIATLSDLDENPGIADDIASIDRIVRQFSEYLRGVQPDEPRQPLHEIARSTVESYQSLGRDVQMDGGSEPALPVPQFAMRRVIENLIENASQHGQEPVRVRVRMSTSGQTELIVTDHGRGIPVEAAEAAVEPFTKLDPARGRGSCGLGLAIVRQLARQLGGGVRFERGENSFAVVVSLGVQCGSSPR